MPITQSAKKKMRRDQRKNLINRRLGRRYKAAVKQMRAQPSPESLKLASSLLDRAAKKQVIHQNKASRLKSKLAGLLVSKKS